MRVSRMTRTQAGSALVVTALVFSACDQTASDAVATKGETRQAAIRMRPVFVDVTERVKLDFISDCGPDRTYFMPENIGAGAALLDYDNDGDLDIYLVSASYPLEAAILPADRPRNRLFRHEPDHTFIDVTDTAGVGDRGYGMGVAVGDIDNDGYVDLYVTNYGPNVLYHNNGDGTFSDITAQAGVDDGAWGVSAGFCDFDQDGFLDLYVVNYVILDPEVKCFDKTGRRDYCGPERFPGAADVLYRNNGDRTFDNATEPSGIGVAGGFRGLGVVCADLTDDGLIDIYVANDNQPNQLWINQGNFTFRDDALLMGIAYNYAGQTEASMGVICADLDNDHDLDLYMTHLRGETDTLYRNQGGGFFEDATAEAGVVAASIRFTSFGVGALDYDLDGDLDLAIVSGHVFRGAVEQGATLSAYWNEYAQPGTLLSNDGNGRFSDVGAAGGDLVTAVQVGRGLALGDLDNDGDPDLLTTADCGRARIFYNSGPPRGHWLIIRAFDPALKRDVHGALVTVHAGRRRWIRSANPGQGFLSSGDPRAYFGLGDVNSVDAIEVRWPGGARERFAGGVTDRVVTLSRGQGTSAGE